MASKQRVKGFSYERALVKLFNDCPNTYSERMWGSNGTTRGLPQEVDLTIDYFDETYHAQAKNWKWAALPAGFRSFCLDILTNVDIGIVKQEGIKNEKSLIIMRLDVLLELLKADSNSELNIEARSGERDT